MLKYKLVLLFVLIAGCQRESTSDIQESQAQKADYEKRLSSRNKGSISRAENRLDKLTIELTLDAWDKFGPISEEKLELNKDDLDEVRLAASVLNDLNFHDKVKVVAPFFAKRDGKKTKFDLEEITATMKEMIEDIDFATEEIKLYRSRK